ncbi:unnamed protein product [Polarella glacialis]|uniref:EF-hand domain-containing protein n=1 Tax=Polarella glacialis TaxID=89957 RepID=A0A813KJX1_POLGL|nr:unnamed protein product [Polarella glacialis]
METKTFEPLHLAHVRVRPRRNDDSFVNEPATSRAGVGKATLLADTPLRQLDEPMWFWTSPSTGVPKQQFLATGAGVRKHIETHAVSADATLDSPCLGSHHHHHKKALRKALRADKAAEQGASASADHLPLGALSLRKAMSVVDDPGVDVAAVPLFQDEVICNSLSKQKIEGLQQLFLHLDVNGEGMLNVKEIEDGLKIVGLCPIPPALLTLIHDMNADRSGVIDYTEFLAETVDVWHFLENDMLWSAFNAFDRNGEGIITMEELKLVFEQDAISSSMGRQTIVEVMTDIFSHGHSKIGIFDLLELLRLSRSSSSSLQGAHASRKSRG